MKWMGKDIDTLPLPRESAGVARNPTKNVVGCSARQSSHLSRSLSPHLRGALASYVPFAWAQYSLQMLVLGLHYIINQNNNGNKEHDSTM